MTWMYVLITAVCVAVLGLCLLVLMVLRRVNTSATAPATATATAGLVDESALAAAEGRAQQEISREREARARAEEALAEHGRELASLRQQLATEREQAGARQSEQAATAATLTARSAELDRRSKALDAALTALAGDQSRVQEELAAARAAAATAEQKLIDGDRVLAEAQRARDAADEYARQERDDLRTLRASLEAREERLAEREERLVVESRAAQEHAAELTESAAALSAARDELAIDRQRLALEREEAQEEARQELRRIAGLDEDQARAEMMARVEHEARLDANALSREIENTARREADQRARGIIVTAIQRLAAEQTSESVVSTLDLPSDEMKGRIIGREGRNIRHFEQVTGVNVMIDDTPGSVLISCFDPVRREVAKLTLAELVADGRIHPARIEEVHERSLRRIEDRIIRAAEDALDEVGISDIDPGLLHYIGALQYRTSYGQNVLRHLVECAHLAGMMAAEIGVDVDLCKRSAFLHDIGKALTHEAEGTHAMVGGELARRHGESPEVVHAIEAHHNEVEPSTVEAVLTQAADAISGSRPGARRESLEAYVHRLERLEEIAAAHEGVERVFAMQAGREVRVMVRPEQMDDNSSHALAKQIAHEIHTELTYPGQIRVTVVRESRATEIAH